MYHKLTYLLTSPWNRALLEKLTGLQLVKKFPAFYGTRRFITAFTSARHLSISWARSIQSIPQYSTSRRSILILIILPSTPGSPQWSLSLRFPCIPSPLHHTLYMPRPSHILLDLITRTILGEQYRSLSSSWSSCLHSPVTSFILGLNILPNTLFQNPQPTFLPHWERPIFTSVQSNSQKKSSVYNKPTRCNSGSIMFIKNYKYALHVSDALCVHHQEHYKL